MRGLRLTCDYVIATEYGDMALSSGGGGGDDDGDSSY